MTTNLGQIYNSVLFRSGIDLRGGWFTPNFFNDAIYSVNYEKMNMLIDVFEKNMEVTSDLQPFVKTLGSAQFPPLLFTAVNSNDSALGGYTDIPEDFWYEARANYTKFVNTGCGVSSSEYAPITLLKQHEFDAVMRDSNSSPVLDPDNNYPVMVIMNNLFYVYPYVRRASITYIKQPTTPVFDYDIISGVPVYLPPNEVHVNSSVLPAGTPSLSVEFEYPESCVDSLIDMIRTYMAKGNQQAWDLQTQGVPKNT
jgi:hypothetical protein